jgi:hypothetical protein
MIGVYDVGSVAAGIAAFIGIAIWDLLRCCVQSWWIKRALESEKTCPHCGKSVNGK